VGGPVHLPPDTVGYTAAIINAVERGEPHSLSTAGRCRTGTGTLAMCRPVPGGAARYRRRRSVAGAETGDGLQTGRTVGQAREPCRDQR
jgi:hypothetical protein